MTESPVPLKLMRSWAEASITDWGKMPGPAEKLWSDVFMANQ
jgi:hypothetical protein